MRWTWTWRSATGHEKGKKHADLTFTLARVLSATLLLLGHGGPNLVPGTRAPVYDQAVGLHTSPGKPGVLELFRGHPKDLCKELIETHRTCPCRRSINEDASFSCIQMHSS